MLFTKKDKSDHTLNTFKSQRNNFYITQNYILYIVPKK